MYRFAVIAPAAHAVRFAVSLVLSPWGYAKEITILGFGVWLVCVVVSGAAKSWSLEDETQLAASNRPAIVRVLKNRHENLTCMFQDFSRIVAVDDLTGDVFFSRKVYGAHRFELGCDADGWGFLTLSGDNRLEWWHSSTGPIELPSYEGEENLDDVSMSRTGRVVSALTLDNRLMTWRLMESGEVAQTDGMLPNRSNRILLSPDGNMLAVRSAGSHLSFHRAADGIVLPIPQQEMNSLIVCSAWSADSTWYAVGVERNQVIMVNVTEPLSDIRTVELSMMPTALALSADSRWLIAALSSGNIEGYCDGERIWSQSTHPTVVRTMDISDDDQSIVVGGIDGRLMTFSTHSGALIETKNVHYVE